MSKRSGFFRRVRVPGWGRAALLLGLVAAHAPAMAQAAGSLPLLVGSGSGGHEFLGADTDAAVLHGAVVPAGRRC